MNNLSTYLNGLNYDYVISYSGLRGEKWQEFQKNKLAELQAALQTARYMRKPSLESELNALQNGLYLSNAQIIDNMNTLHPTTEIIHKFEKKDTQWQRILAILYSKEENYVVAACVPIFRDALVFYASDNTIQGILYICFGCIAIADECYNRFEIDSMIFTHLRAILLQLGHPIKDRE